MATNPATTPASMLPSTLPIARVSPSYVLRDSFDMTELMPALDKIAITNANSKSSALLHLPAELRNRIFCHLLGGHEICLGWEAKVLGKRIFEVRRAGDDSTLTNEEMKNFLNITIVCRQIYVETGMLPFTTNTVVFSHLLDTDDAAKWLAQKLLPAQQGAITTVRCPVQKLFFEFEAGPVTSRHCTGTFRQLEALECLILEAERFRLSDEEKEVVRQKIRTANQKNSLKIMFLEK